MIKTGCTQLQHERLRFISPKCSNCGQVIKRNDYFHRCPPNYTYHAQCFKCQFCHSALNKGDRYLCLEGQLLCEGHHMPIPECGLTDSQREAVVRKIGKSSLDSMFTPNRDTCSNEYVHHTARLSFIHSICMCSRYA